MLILLSSMVAFTADQGRSRPTKLQGAPAGDRSLPGVTIDVDYSLHVPANWWMNANPAPRYADVMQSLHGENIWESPDLHRHLGNLGLESDTPVVWGSSLRFINELINRTMPRLVLEVGVFRGSTSIRMAKLMDKTRGLEESFIISMDTWLLDLRFAWKDAWLQTNRSQRHKRKGYFTNTYLAGASQMYYVFLANCLATKTSHRIVPLPTASANGALALIAHRLRPSLMYIDASHANPDAFIDYENFFNILAPGGIMAVDDLNVPSVAAAFDSLTRRHNLHAVSNKRTGQGYVQKEV